CHHLRTESGSESRRGLSRKWRFAKMAKYKLGHLRECRETEAETESTGRLYVCRYRYHSCPRHPLYVATTSTIGVVFNGHVAAVSMMWCRIGYHAYLWWHRVLNFGPACELFRRRLSCNIVGSVVVIERQP